MNIAVYCSARMPENEALAADAARLGTWIGSNGHTLVYGGLDCGLMGIVASAAAEAGGKVVGVVPQSRLQRQHSANTVNIACTSLHERKEIMEENADCFVAIDGGFGTLDEVMAALATGHFFNNPKPIFLLNRDGLYTPLQRLAEGLVLRGLASPETASRLNFLPAIDDIIEALSQHSVG